jgi:hypothetical protein
MPTHQRRDSLGSLMHRNGLSDRHLEETVHGELELTCTLGGETAHWPGSKYQSIEIRQCSPV